MTKRIYFTVTLPPHPVLDDVVTFYEGGLFRRTNSHTSQDGFWKYGQWWREDSMRKDEGVMLSFAFARPDWPECQVRINEAYYRYLAGLITGGATN